MEEASLVGGEVEGVRVVLQDGASHDYCYCHQQRCNCDTYCNDECENGMITKRSHNKSQTYENI